MFDVTLALLHFWLHASYVTQCALSTDVCILQIDAKSYVLDFMTVHW